MAQRNGNEERFKKGFDSLISVFVPPDKYPFLSWKYLFFRLEGQIVPDSKRTQGLCGENISLIVIIFFVNVFPFKIFVF